MNKLKLIFLGGLMAVLFWPSAPAVAYVEDMGYLAKFGDLVKLENDHDPATTADEAVYYIDSELQRRAFPNRRIYESWYDNFSGVREITAEEMARIRLSGNVTYRPGTRLIKIPSVPRVYAVEPGAKLRWIETEAIARELYGPDWAQRVDDVSEAYFANYTETVPLTAPVWPTGTVVRRASDTAYFMIEGAGKRYITPGTQALLRVQDRNVINTDSDLSDYFDMAHVSQAELRLVDTGQDYYSETLPPASFDFPTEPEPTQAAGSDATLYVFRLTVGEPVIVRQLSVRLDGALWDGDQPLITDLRFEDLHGNNMFGIKPLESTPGATSETFTMNGAYTVPENTIELIRLRGQLSPNYPVDQTITANFVESGLNLADGGNGNRLPHYWSAEEFPEQRITVGD
jgi:hypothetical protein